MTSSQNLNESYFLNIVCFSDSCYTNFLVTTVGKLEILYSDVICWKIISLEIVLSCHMIISEDQSCKDLTPVF